MSHVIIIISGIVTQSFSKFLNSFSSNTRISASFVEWVPTPDFTPAPAGGNSYIDWEQEVLVFWEVKGSLNYCEIVWNGQNMYLDLALLVCKSYN